MPNVKTARWDRVIMGPTRQIVRKGELTQARQRLVVLMQEMDFGRVHLHVRGGEPQFDPKPRVVRKVKIGAPRPPRPEVKLTGFVLKKEVVELFRDLEELDNGMVKIEVRHGLPFSMEIETEPKA